MEGHAWKKRPNVGSRLPAQYETQKHLARQENAFITHFPLVNKTTTLSSHCQLWFCDQCQAAKLHQDHAQWTTIVETQEEITCGSCRFATTHLSRRVKREGASHRVALMTTLLLPVSDIPWVPSKSCCRNEDASNVNAGPTRRQSFRNANFVNSTQNRKNHESSSYFWRTRHFLSVAWIRVCQKHAKLVFSRVRESFRTLALSIHPLR